MTIKTYFIPQLFGILLLGFVFSSCEDLLERTPPEDSQNLLPENAIETPEDVKEILVSAYDVLGNTYNGNAQNLFNLLGDNLERPVQQDDYTSVWLRNTSIFNGNVGGVFANLYRGPLRANTVIENKDMVDYTNSDFNPLQFEAEARFIRALCHFDIVRGWAHPYDYTPGNEHPGVAIRTSSDIVNASRSTVKEVYDLVLSDLAFAQENLTDQNPVYATRWAALALEAEVRFQMHEYDRAFQLANQVITEAPYDFDTEVNRYQYPAVSPEAIFYIFTGIRPSDGSIDSRNGGFRGNYYSGPEQVTTLNFTEEFYGLQKANGDLGQRPLLYQTVNQEEVSFFVTNMFEPEFFHIPVLTITQMKLIRAESAAETGAGLTIAIQDINDIRGRAYGSVAFDLIASASDDDIIEAARLERRLEFPCTGQRFHDLKRIGAQGEEVIVREKPYDCPGMILQFPSTEQTDLFPLNPGGGC